MCFAGVAALPGLAPALGPLAPDLSELAAAAAAAVHDQPAAAGAPKLGGGAVSNVGGSAAAALPARPRAPLWQPPLGAQPWKQEEGAPGEESEVQQAQQEGALHAVPGAFQPPQYRQLHRLLHQHCQLLMQVRGDRDASDAGEGGAHGDTLLARGRGTAHLYCWQGVLWEGCWSTAGTPHKLCLCCWQGVTTKRRHLSSIGPHLALLNHTHPPAP